MESKHAVRPEFDSLEDIAPPAPLAFPGMNLQRQAFLGRQNPALRRGPGVGLQLPQFQRLRGGARFAMDRLLARPQQPQMMRPQPVGQFDIQRQIMALGGPTDKLPVASYKVTGNLPNAMLTVRGFVPGSVISVENNGGRQLTVDPQGEARMQGPVSAGSLSVYLVQGTPSGTGVTVDIDAPGVQDRA